MSGQIYGAEVGSGYEGHWVRFAEPLDSEAWRQLYLYPGFGSAWGLEWPASPGKDCSCKVLFLKKKQKQKNPITSSPNPPDKAIFLRVTWLDALKRTSPARHQILSLP